MSKNSPRAHLTKADLKLIADATEFYYGRGRAIDLTGIAAIGSFDRKKVRRALTVYGTAEACNLARRL